MLSELVSTREDAFVLLVNLLVGGIGCFRNLDSWPTDSLGLVNVAITELK